MENIDLGKGLVSLNLKMTVRRLMMHKSIQLLHPFLHQSLGSILMAIVSTVKALLYSEDYVMRSHRLVLAIRIRRICDIIFRVHLSMNS